MDITTDRKVFLSAMKKALDEYEYYYNDSNTISSIIEKINDDYKSHFVSVSPKDLTKVTYSNGKGVESRVSTTFARYIRRQLGISNNIFPDYRLEHFSFNIIGNIMKLKKNYVGIIKILRGEDILDFYVKSNKTSWSCMTGAANTDKIRMFAENLDKICLVTSLDVGRALLWTDDEGKKLLDYSYPSGTIYSKLIKIWAKDRGYYTIEDGSWNAPKMTVTVKTTKLYPRLDTLHWATLDKENNKAVLRNFKHDDTTHSMRSTDGLIYRA